MAASRAGTALVMKWTMEKPLLGDASHMNQCHSPDTKGAQPWHSEEKPTPHVLAQQKPVLLSLSFAACHFTM